MLRVRITGSRLLTLLLLATHLAAAACLLAYVPIGWSVSGGAVLLSSAVFHLRRDALGLARDAVVELGVAEDGYCEFVTRAGATIEGRLQDSTFVTPLLTVIRIRPDGRRGTRALTLLPDSATAEDLRALRVWLRHRGPNTPGT